MATRPMTWGSDVGAALPTAASEQRAPRWSWRAGRIAGIKIYVHATFLVLLAWIGASHLLQGEGAVAALAGVALVTAIFAIVVLHELGHALVARRFGIRTRDIILLPIGGVARLERMPERPREELLVALAGPAVNVALAGVLFGTSALAHHELSPAALHLVGGPLLLKLAWINVSLAAFNLLPAFPMDGGRVLRAALAMRMDRVKATAIAGGLGQAMALAFGLLGLWTNPMLVFIALFVWIGAQEETMLVQTVSMLHGVAVGHAMLRDFRVLSPWDTIGDACAHILTGFQADFPVVEDGHLVGVLTREDAIRALTERGREGDVSHAMHREFAVADAHEPLDAVMPRLAEATCHALPVLERGRLVGMLRLENIGNLIATRAALGAETAR